MQGTAVMASKRRRNARAEFANRSQLAAGDYGPRLRIKRGDVAVADVADPDNPNRTLRRASSVVHYTRLSLPSRCREAADRLAVQAERAKGARWRPTGMMVRLAPWQKGHPAEWQLAAQRDLNRAAARMHGAAWALVCLVVVENRPISSLAHGGYGRQAVRDELCASLHKLADIWGID